MQGAEVVVKEMHRCRCGGTDMELLIAEEVPQRCIVVLVHDGEVGGADEVQLEVQLAIEVLKRCRGAEELQMQRCRRGAEEVHTCRWCRGGEVQRCWRGGAGAEVLKRCRRGGADPRSTRCRCRCRGAEVGA